MQSTGGHVKILIAPDKFKGTLSARDVAEKIADGLREVLPDAKIDLMPLADGGEGTAEVLCTALGGTWHQCRAHDPLAREITARYVWIADCKLAIMEMSEAAGMRRVVGETVDIDCASTFGVGEMLLDATQCGAREVIIGLGGSATNDGGVGMARALGFRFFNHQQEHADELAATVSDLTKLARIVRPYLSFAQAKDRGEGKSSRVAQPGLPRIIAAVDVRNPLLGANGATRVFGPQKGATPENIDNLERGLTRLADVVAKEFEVDYRNEPGAGAAGGLGFGLMSFCGAKIRPGFDVVAEAVGLEARLRQVDVVITGEGSLDRQTLEGKTPAGVAHLARKFGKRVFAIVGRAVEDQRVRQLFTAVYENARPGISDEESMRRAAQLVRENARELAKTL